MLTVFVVVHLLIAIGMIALILLQKTEGNAAGGGFSVSSMSAMMQPRARPNPLSRATTVLGIAFFVTSIGLGLLARQLGPAPSILDEPGAASSSSAPRVDEIRAPTPAAPAAATPAPDAAAPAAATPAPAPATPAAPPAVPKN